MENLEINEDLSNFNNPLPSDAQPVQQKLDEFISLLSETAVDNEELQVMQRKFNIALREAADSTALQPYVKSRNGVLQDPDDELDKLWSIGQQGKKKRLNITIYGIVSKVLRVIIALLLILLGFGMIIMPAPQYFEMFTLFYINPNDGVTIMDVISLIVAFVGVYILIGTITKLRGK